ncbi:MAG: SDR family NAD(P)-dependent oxidoreductase [Actinobacteria bacterium]|nr:SDR family NAD(P)-dependent oxidoreductase [Actinomycetota bacterium]
MHNRKMGSGQLRSVVITGGASGIGKAMALAFAEKGCRVGVLDIDKKAAEETLETIRSLGAEGEALPCDVTRLEEVEKAADHFFGSWGHVDIIVNNAGIGSGGFVGDLPIPEWKKIVDIDLWGVIHGCHTFIPRMKTQGGGHVINTASTAGIMPVMGFAPYCASKAGVVAISQVLRMELAPFNIGVTVVCPSPIDTNIIENSMKQIDVRCIEETDWAISMVKSAMDSSKVSAEDLAEKVVRAVEKNRLYVLTNATSRRAWLAARLGPSAYFDFWAFLHRHGLALKVITRLAEKGVI